MWWSTGKRHVSRRRRQNSGTNVPEFWRRRLETCLFPMDHPYHQINNRPVNEIGKEIDNNFLVAINIQSSKSLLNINRGYVVEENRYKPYDVQLFVKSYIGHIFTANEWNNTFWRTICTMQLVYLKWYLFDGLDRFLSFQRNLSEDLKTDLACKGIYVR